MTHDHALAEAMPRRIALRDGRVAQDDEYDPVAAREEEMRGWTR